MSLTDFLSNRLDEDEKRAHVDENIGHISGQGYRRALADVRAKRQLAEDYHALNADYKVTRDPQTEARRFQALIAVARAASVYADHPDYNSDWTP